MPPLVQPATPHIRIRGVTEPVPDLTLPASAKQRFAGNQNKPHPALQIRKPAHTDDSTAPARHGSSRGTESRNERRPASGRPRGQAEQDNPVKWIFIGALVILVIIILAMAAGNANQRPPPTRPQFPQRTHEENEPKRYAELNGKTMAEWMSENNKDNKMLQDRQARLHRQQGGSPP